MSAPSPLLLLVLAVAGCARGADPCALDREIGSIDDALDTIDALPSPVTLPCFLAAARRPLGLVATSDVFSTQPAQGARSPRLLVRTDAVTLTAVPVGEGRDLLEFGERHTPGSTVKAEVAFPVTTPVDRALVFDRVRESAGADATGCRVCHTEETDLGDGRFANTELRPPDGMVVPLDVLLGEREACAAVDDAASGTEEEAFRCAMFAGLLDHGEVVERPFADEVATAFGPRP